MIYTLLTFAQSLIPQIALMVIIVAGLSVYMIATRNRIRRSMNQPRSTSRERYAELSKRVHLTRDLEEVMNDLDELARQVNGKLDVRFAKLEAVIRDADERIDQLTRLLRRAGGDETIDVTVGADGPQSAHEVPEHAPPRDAADTNQATTDDTQHDGVFMLADSGLTPSDIAEQTNRTTGEVELILALRRARNQAEAISKSRAPISAGSRP